MCMKRYLCAVTLVLFPASISFAQAANQPSSRQVVLENLASLPLGFEQNVGQVNKSIGFVCRAAGYSVSLSRGELLVVFHDQGSGKQGAETLRINLAGADENVEPQGIEVLPGVTNYYIGNDPTQWKTNVRQFRQVRYHNVYPGVDLVFYGNHRQLEFDFDLAPEADASLIGLNFDGATVEQHGQDLELVTPSGNVAVLKKPKLYQNDGRARKTIFGGYVVRKHDQVAFSVGRYDKRQPLVIDPALIYSTFAQINSQTGGADVPFAIAVDSSGAAYVTGLTNTGLPPLGSSAFVIKLNPAGSALVYEAHLGGASATGFNGYYQIVAGPEIRVDATGDVYVVGTTQQGDFPTTRGTYSTTAYCGPGVGCLQPFATKLDANGAIVYSTFLVQASALDSAGPAPSAIAVDSNGALYVTGTATHQSVTGNGGSPPITVPALTTTPGAFQTTRKNDSSGFVLKLHPDGSKLDYATYLGGSTGETPGGIAVDSNGVAYVDGGTSSSDFPTTQGAFQTANSGTNTFFAKLKSDGSGLLYSTFLSGPSGQSIGTSIAIDFAKSPFLAGMTATTIPTPMFATNLLPAFAAKFDASGNLAYSTLLPHPITFRIDNFYATPPPSSIAVDTAGAAYVATAFDYASDIAVNKLDSAGSVVYSIMAGSVLGNNTRFGGMALDTHQNFYVAGTAGVILHPVSPCGTITSVVTTPSAFQMFPLGPPGDTPMYVQKFTQSLGSAVAIPNPRKINFSAILQKGTSSAPRTMQLYNYGDATLTIGSIGIGGANAFDFAISTGSKTCGATLPAQSSCSFLVVFTPTVDTGTRNATVDLNFGGLPSQSLPLTGQSGFPIFQASPAPLDLGNVVIGNVSEAVLTITNTGTGPLNFPSSPAIVGPNAGEFCTGPSPAAGQGCNIYGGPFAIPPGATGGVRVVFFPNVPGPATAQLIVVTNDPGSPRVFQIMGNGIAPGNGTFNIAPANGSSTSSTITAGKMATYNLLVAAASNFGGGTIAVSCNGAPTGASCNVSPSSFSLRSGASQNLTVSVATARTSASLNRPHPGLWWSLATMIGMVVVRPRRRRSRGMLIIIGTLTLCGAMLSCGGGSPGVGGGGKTGTPAGRYALTVTASGNGSSNSTNLTLIVK